jgi:hypothetical protein
MDIVTSIFKDTCFKVDNNFSEVSIEPERGLYSFVNKHHINTAHHGVYEIFVRKNAEGLDTISQFDDIMNIHNKFFK